MAWLLSSASRMAAGRAALRAVLLAAAVSSSATADESQNGVLSGLYHGGHVTGTYATGFGLPSDGDFPGVDKLRFSGFLLGIEIDQRTIGAARAPKPTLRASVRPDSGREWTWNHDFDQIGSTRLRLAFGLGQTQIFATGGLGIRGSALGHEATGRSGQNFDAPRVSGLRGLDMADVGFSAGGGFEHKLGESVNARVEALYFGMENGNQTIFRAALSLHAN